MKPVTNENGAAALEFALVLPLLLLLVFGIIEFGILLYDKAMITNACREGARAGIVFSHPDRINDAEIEEKVNTYCQAYLISFGTGAPPIPTINISPPEVDRIHSPAGTPITVKVDYPFNFLFFSNLISMFGGNIENQFDLSAQTVMRLE